MLIYSADCVLGIAQDLTGVVDPIVRNGPTEAESRIGRNQRIEIDPDLILKDAGDGAKTRIRINLRGGEDCTFETLVKIFGLRDEAVLAISEMVHDADLEDEKFHRYECIGINAVLSGWARSDIKDFELLEKGMECFEGLYKELRK